MSDLSMLYHQAPSVFATEPYGGMSGKYKFIQTSAVVEKLLSEGFVVANAFESRTRIGAKRGFTKHMLRLRHNDLVPKVGDLIPEIIMTNSHDGASAFQLSAGIYRLVCSNGLTVGNDMVSIRQRHSGDIDDVVEGVFSVVNEMPSIVDMAERWQGVTLSREQQLAFAQAAIPLRWGADANNNFPVTNNQLLTVRRQADATPTLWNTFNVIQEHIIKGGIRARSTDGRRRRTRTVASVNEDQRLNKALWTLAMEMEKLAA